MHERVVVQEPDRLEAELGTFREAARHQVADLAGAHDQRRAALAASDRPGARDEEARAAGREEQRGQDPGLDGLARRVRVVDDDDART